MRFSPLFVALTALLSASAFAQQNEARTLDTVTVSASRTGQTAETAPQTVVIIDRQAIEQQLRISGNSSDVLSSLLPSYTPSRGKMTGSGETLRGRTPLILVDGIPQSNPLRPTGREAHTIDYAMVERIEVIQGANAMNGLGATGGTINLITRRPEPGAVNQHVGVQTTVPTRGLNAETTSYRADYRISGSNGRWDYLFGVGHEDQGLWLDGDGTAIGTDTTQGDLMATRAYDLHAKLGYWIDDNQELQFSSNRYRIKSKAEYLTVAGNRTTGLPTTSVRGTPPGTPPWNDVWTTGLSYTHHDLAGMELRAMVFNQEFEGLFGGDRSSTFQDPQIAPIGTLYDQSRSVASKWGAKTSLGRDDLVGGKLKLTGGIDLLQDSGKQDLYGTGRTYVPNSEFRNAAGFVQAEYKLLPTLTAQGGIRREEAKLRIDSYQTLYRYNRVNVQGGKLSFGETLYNAGLVFAPVDGFNVFASYSEGFGMPDVGRVLRSINTPSTSVADLNALEPVLTRNSELGARLRTGAWEAEAAVFQSRSDLGTRIISVDGAFQMAREKTQIEGLDASVRYQLNEAHKLGLSYAWTRGRYDSDGDSRLDARLDGLNIAPNRAIATWSAQWTPAFSTFVQGQYAFNRTFDEAAKQFQGYALFDLAAEYKLARGSVQVGVANLFDRQYITYYSQSALIEPDRYFAGRGRAVTVGYQLDF
ncbi:TonB-dependent receptor [Stenotrophomonas maltophilia]|uniref:TonB-dependent receptor n=1 Tax=Stenotrophomonas maltophilia TaxID=40324 RepID=UPI002894C223|nr:TonB-dependent receptor [Stenotrophomonas maltophilia]MDT3502524.1 TonB-dependent receptor [Stenotrophomonas maltophilia]